jgi:hypothetical protein
MKRRVFLVPFLVALILSLGGFTLVGCQISCVIGEPSKEPTTATTSLSETTATVAASSSISTTSTTPAGVTATSQETTSYGTSTLTTDTSTTDRAEATTTTRHVVAPTAVDTTDRVVAMWTRFEEIDPHMVWTGDWHAVYFTGTGGTGMDIDGKGMVVIHFRGTRITVVAVRNYTSGIAAITLGDSTELVDLYGPSGGTSEKVWTSPRLDNGLHMVVVEWNGAKNALSDGTAINIDAVEVAGTLVYP